MVIARKPATLADLEALPTGVVGEIIEGVLYTQPRPRPRHARIGLAIGSALFNPFDLGNGGPGGWWILTEPGIELPGSPEVVPDVAGWRRERLPEFPAGAVTLAPDWVCEVFSPSTRKHDLHVKVPFYARIGVRWMWLIDPEARVLLAHRLVDGHWLQVGNFADAEKARAEPFDGIEIDLAAWWPPEPAP